jgi:hypothetical protein
LWYSRAGPAARSGRIEQAQHAALAVLAARNAGERAPEIVGVGQGREGGVLLVSVGPEGEPFEHPHDAMLRVAWSELRALHAKARITHGGLQQDAVRVSGETVELVGLSKASMFSDRPANCEGLGAEAPELAAVKRVKTSQVIIALAAIIAAKALVSQVADVGFDTLVDELENASTAWLLVVFLIQIASSSTEYMSLKAVVTQPLPFSPTMSDLSGSSPRWCCWCCVLATPSVRNKIVPVAREILTSVQEIVSSPRTVGRIFAGAILNTLFGALALAGTMSGLRTAVAIPPEQAVSIAIVHRVVMAYLPRCWGSFRSTG